MKKSILVVVAIFSIAIMFTSCKETKKDADKHDMHEHEHEAGETAHSAYQCPMDCEKGKTYQKEGNCPVCKMDLKANEGEMKHAEGCKCKEGGECKCEEGKCQCKAEEHSEAGEHAEKTMDCSKCEPGKCECKAEAVLAPKASSGCGSKGSTGCKTSCTSKV